MKIISLNIRHGGGKRIADILEYLIDKEADVIVFTEYRENANSEIIHSRLREEAFTVLTS